MHPPGADDGHCATPWFARSTRAVLDSSPALLTFDGSDFLDRFLAGLDDAIAGADHPFPNLVPMRDWAEPPRATQDASGRSRIPAHLERAPIDPGDADGEGALDAEAVVAAEEAKTGPRWFRKLYLPVHQHFHLVATEVVCDRGSSPDGDRPPVDAKRVTEVGAVIRRLARTATAEHWEDWVALKPGVGAWVRLATPSMTGENSQPLDPAAPRPVPALDPAVRARLGLALTDPLPALSPVPMSQLPPAQRNGRSTWFAYLPLSSRDREQSDDAVAPPTPAAMAAEAGGNLDRGLGGETVAVRDRVRAAWAALLEALSSSSTSHSRFGQDPGVSFAAALASLQAAVDAVPGSSATLSLTTSRLAEVMREAATATSPVFPGMLELQTPRWDVTSNSVAGRWASTLPAHLQTVVRNQGGTALRAKLQEAVDDVLAAPIASGASDDHRVIAAVLLWVRAHRILLHRTLRGSLPPEVDAFNPEARTVRDPYDPDTDVPLVTVGSSSGELEALVVAEEQRATTPRPWAPVSLTSGAAAVHVAVHRAALGLEDALAELDRVGGAGGSGWAAMLQDRAALVRGGFGLERGLGLDLDAQPERGLLVLDALHLDAGWPAIRAAVVDHYDPAGDPSALATLDAEARARQLVVRPRFDGDHLYAVWVYARITDPRPCHAPRLTWSQRTEPFRIADHHDLLGTKPVAMQLPDLPNLLRDLPRMARAGALPLAAVTTPPNSGFVVGEDPEDTAREWGIAWICSFGIPVFTIVAWILFSIILSILLMLPGFAWMLLLKICIPVPVPKGES